MSLEALLDRFGQAPLLAAGGLLIGFVFGFFAQRSRFCLRSAVIEFARGMPGGIDSGLSAEPGSNVSTSSMLAAAASTSA